jgi:hypothetical protein
MDGHTLGARGMRTVADALREVSPQVTKIYMFGDSRTILQALKAGATPPAPDNIEVIWGWVKSEDNAADMASRTDAVPSDLVEGTEWQNRPAYLRLPESEWLIRRDIMEDAKELPKEEMKKLCL